MKSTTKSQPFKILLQVTFLAFVLMSGVTGCGNSGSSSSADSSSNQNQDTDNDSEKNETVADTDSDSITDDIDNCINVSNPDQSDINNDKIGDACDPYYQAQLSIVLDEL
ncbi:MAG: thrombospondin type 3 repeat-containing protein [Gammaproteobacteria bacterium]|nr:thrombospondin type 3 repeat-containing protein [Gammaproteobacteria bacterium]